MRVWIRREVLLKELLNSRNSNDVENMTVILHVCVGGSLYCSDNMGKIRQFFNTQWCAPKEMGAHTVAMLAVTARKVQYSMLLEKNMIAFIQMREIFLPGLLMSRYLFSFFGVFVTNLSHPLSIFVKACISI